jgi:hypothetical protein
MRNKMIDQKTQRSSDENILQAENFSFPGCGIGSEKGVVLIVVLVLSAVSLAIMTALLYMITTGTQTSGLQKRYKTALEAGIGGGNVFCQLISARGDTTLIGAAKLSNFNIKTPAGCKDTLSIDPTDATSYDAQVDLGTYRVYAKIVATTPGNTVTDTGLLNSSVATSNTGLVAVTPISYLYAVEVVSQNIAKEDERAKISFLYQF